MLSRRVLLRGGAAFAAGLPIVGRACPAHAAAPPSGLDALRALDLENPFMATIVGTPPPLRADLPELAEAGRLESIRLPVLPDREIPEVLWYHRRGLKIDLCTLPKAAPLAFVIAGTGSSTSSGTAQLLARIFAARGMHTAVIPSPTFSEFVATASATCVPGRPELDARDLHRVMRLARIRVERRAQVTGFYLAGFSLGAMNAAFVGALDRREDLFGFDRIVLVNPPFDLWTSLSIVDELLDERIARDPEAVRNFIEEVFNAFAAVYTERPGTEFTGEDLYLTLASLGARENLLKLLVGLVFRVAASSLAFTTDVMINAGYLLPADARPGLTASLTNVFEASLNAPFASFAEQVVLPFYQRSDPSFDRRQLRAEPTLQRLATLLATDRRFGLITNRDDFVLGSGQLAELVEPFGDRAVVLPFGGHGGSIGRPDFVQAFDRLLAA